MFQRLKGAIDSRIAEEQARQRISATISTPPPAPRSSSSTRNSNTNSRNDSPSTRSRRLKSGTGSKDDDQPPARRPDPSEFESPLGEDSEESAKAVTAEAAQSTDAMPVNPNLPTEGGGEGSGTALSDPSVELPAEVMAKLQRLEKMVPRYKELLKSYRIAHALVGQIEPFEKALRESTPLMSISDPTALAEYLNQLNLKGDMVMDEFKRVSAERNDYKNKLEEAEKRATAAEERATVAEREVVNIKEATLEVAASTDKADTASIDTPSASVRSPVSSVLGGLFSPKQKAVTTDNKDVSEEFFSYDEENEKQGITQLQIELKEKDAMIIELKSKVSNLERDLADIRESRNTLEKTLEQATEAIDNTNSTMAERELRVSNLQEQLEKKHEELELTVLAKQRTAELLTRCQKNNLVQGEQISAMHQAIETQALKMQALEKDLHSPTRIFLENSSVNEEEGRATDKQLTEDLENKIALAMARSEQAEDTEDVPTASIPETSTPATGAAKKKNKKKKKAGTAAATTTSKEESVSTGTPNGESTSAAPASSSLSGDTLKADIRADILKLKEDFVAARGKQLESEILGLQNQIVDKDEQIKKLKTKQASEDNFKEKYFELDEIYKEHGQELIEARQEIKELEVEKRKFQDRITTLEEQLLASKAQSEESAKAEADLKNLTAEYEELKIKSSTLQSDLGAAEKLATDRYKEFTTLRQILDKAQPEMTSLRAENTSLKSAKEDLATRTSELRRLEAREKDLKSDVAAFKKQAADRDAEVKSLNEKVTQETTGRQKAEDQCRIASRDLRRTEADKIQLSATAEKSTTELMRVQEEAGLLRVKVDNLTANILKLTEEQKVLKEEVLLRTEQYAKTQALIGSMSDQASEIAMQLKEAKSRSESFEEEMAEMQRLLNERTREGETMRRLLADVDDRADAKVREMRERMEAAIEERDRAEDEASTNGRRRAREVDELKLKIRDFERDLKRAVDDRDELSRSEKEWRRKRDELESSSEGAAKEVSDIRSAMGELRAALDGSEKQVRDAEKQKGDLKRVLEEANARYEKLQKEFKVLQLKQGRLEVAPSSRSSIDSGRGSNGVSGGNGSGGTDVAYLKTILLQFLQVKDKKVQADLVRTVIGQLLQFNKQDQEKWIAVISAK